MRGRGPRRRPFEREKRKRKTPTPPALLPLSNLSLSLSALLTHRLPSDDERRDILRRLSPAASAETGLGAETADSSSASNSACRSSLAVFVVVGIFLNFETEERGKSSPVGTALLLNKRALEDGREKRERESEKEKDFFSHLIFLFFLSSVDRVG